MKHPSALAVMLKSPEAGRVKTRLTPPLTHARAASLYRCFIEDTMRTVRGVAMADVFAAHTPESARDDVCNIVGEGVEVIAQSGASLGERIISVFQGLFARGYKNVVVIGSDSPDLPGSFIEDALARLAKGADVVLGPATDGGYYLVGLSVLTRAPFEGIAWSTEVVLDETLERARGAGLAVSLLEPWHDIDRPVDLDHLRKGSGAPSSSAFLASLDRAATRPPSREAKGGAERGT